MGGWRGSCNEFLSEWSAQPDGTALHCCVLHPATPSPSNCLTCWHPFGTRAQVIVLSVCAGCLAYLSIITTVSCPGAQDVVRHLFARYNFSVSDAKEQQQQQLVQHKAAVTATARIMPHRLSPSLCDEVSTSAWATTKHAGVAWPQQPHHVQQSLDRKCESPAAWAVPPCHERLGMPSSTIKLAQLQTDEGVSPRDVALRFVLKHCPLPPAATFEGACVASLLSAPALLGLCQL
jgi:hypothetical protein